MVTLTEAQQQLEARQQQLEEAKSQASQFRPQVTQTSQQLLRATPTSQTKLQFQEYAREQAKQQVLEQIESQEQELAQVRQQYQSYLSTPSGIVQYAKEHGIQPKVVERSIGVHLPTGEIERRTGKVYIYETPYGTYEDTSKFEGIKQQSLQQIKESSQISDIIKKQKEELEKQGYSNIQVQRSGNEYSITYYQPASTVSIPQQQAKRMSGEEIIKQLQQGFEVKQVIPMSIAPSNFISNEEIMRRLQGETFVYKEPTINQNVLKALQGETFVYRGQYPTPQSWMQKFLQKTTEESIPYKIEKGTITGADKWLYGWRGEGLPKVFGEQLTAQERYTKPSILFMPSYLAYQLSTKAFNPQGYDVSKKLQPPEIFKTIGVAVEEYIATPIYQTSLFLPAMSNFQASTNYIEPAFRVKPLRPISKNPPRAVGYDVVPYGKDEIMFSQKVVIPRRMEYVQTPLREYFGYEPYKRLYSPQVTIRQLSPSVKISDTGYFEGNILAQQIRPRQNWMYASRLTGTSKILTEPYKPVDIYETRQIQTLAKSEYNIFKGIKKQTGLYYPERQQGFVSELSLKKYAKVGVNYMPKTSYVTPGKTITEAKIFGIQQKIASYPMTDIYRYNFLVRETSRPFMRVKGFPTVKGLSFVGKGEITKPEPIGGMETFLSKPQTKVVAKQISSFLSLKSNLPTVKPTSRVSTAIVTTNKPFMAVSSQAKIETRSQTKERQVQERRANQEMKNILGTKEVNLEVMRVTPRGFQVSRTQSPEVSPRVTPGLSVGLSQPESLTQTPRQTQQTRQMVRQVLSPRTTTTQLIITTPVKPPVTTKKFGFLVPIKSERRFFKTQGKSREVDVFESQMKRRGKWVTIGKGTFQQVFGIGISRVKQTLGASLRILKAGKPVALPKPSTEFRFGKKAPFIVVQKSPFRLSSRSEVSEIIKSRRGGIQLF